MKPSEFTTLKMLGLTSRARLREIIETMQPSGGLVLDAGCGGGEYVISLGHGGFEVVGVDRDASLLRSIGPAIRLIAGRCHLLVADLTKVPFRDSSFRSVICMEVLNTLKNDEDAVWELARVLERHGTCTISLPNKSYPIIYDPLNKFLERIGLGHCHVGIWTSPTIKRLYQPSEFVPKLRRLGLHFTGLTYIGKWLVPALENYLALLFYYRVLVPKFRTRAAFEDRGIHSFFLTAIAKALDFILSLDKLPKVRGTHFIITAKKSD